MLLFYIRHGEPIYDPDSLTPLGERQAEAISKRLALYGIDEIYSSSSNRAQLTARPTSELCHKPVNILDWCSEDYTWNEIAYTDSDGRKTWLYQNDAMRKLLVSKEVTELGNEWYKHKAFSGLNYEYGMARVRRGTYRFLKSLGYDYDDESNYYRTVSPNDKRVALFAHEGFGMAFLSVLLDIPYPAFCTHFGLSHSSMTVVRFGNE